MMPTTTPPKTTPAPAKVKGSPLRLSADEISAAAVIDEGDLAAAKAFFRRAAPARYKGLLSARQKKRGTTTSNG
jgi:hypothetical protein